jgi:hypothetical protein
MQLPAIGEFLSEVKLHLGIGWSRRRFGRRFTSNVCADQILRKLGALGGVGFACWLLGHLRGILLRRD